MLDFLRRLRVMRHLVRQGRGGELDRVLAAMRDGGHFTGAKGCLLMELAKDGGWIELHLKKGGNRHLSDAALGRAWFRRLSRHICAMRHKPFGDGEGGE